MDRVSQLKGQCTSSPQDILDTTATSESYQTANESSSSKYYSFADEDASFDISQDVTIDAKGEDTLSETVTNNESPSIVSDISSIGNSNLGGYKIDHRIEAANILSGGVEIFDDTDNSYDGNGLIIDDNVETDIQEDNKSSPDDKPRKDESGINETMVAPDPLPTNATPNAVETTDAPSSLDQEVKIVEKNDGAEQVDSADVLLPLEATDAAVSAPPEETNGVILQIDGKNVDAFDIGNGLYLYRKESGELTAVQVLPGEEPQCKFLKVRHNAEGKLELYEEIVEIPNPNEELDSSGSQVDVETKKPHLPFKDLGQVINDHNATSKAIALVANEYNEKELSKSLTVEPSVPIESKIPSIDVVNTTPSCKIDQHVASESVKLIETSKKSPLGSLTLHSTSSREGIPLTKSMVDLQLNPGRHTDALKKTIEVCTDSCRQKCIDNQSKEADLGKCADKEMLPYSKTEKKDASDTIIDLPNTQFKEDLENCNDTDKPACVTKVQTLEVNAKETNHKLNNSTSKTDLTLSNKNENLNTCEIKQADPENNKINTSDQVSATSTISTKVAEEVPEIMMVKCNVQLNAEKNKIPDNKEQLLHLDEVMNQKNDSEKCTILKDIPSSPKNEVLTKPSLQNKEILSFAIEKTNRSHTKNTLSCYFNSAKNITASMVTDKKPNLTNLENDSKPLLTKVNKASVDFINLNSDKVVIKTQPEGGNLDSKAMSTGLIHRPIKSPIKSDIPDLKKVQKATSPILSAVNLVTTSSQETPKTPEIPTISKTGIVMAPKLHKSGSFDIPIVNKEKSTKTASQCTNLSGIEKVLPDPKKPKDDAAFDDKRFVNKYISEALGMKNVSASTLESLKSNHEMKLNREFDVKSPDKKHSEQLPRHVSPHKALSSNTSKSNSIETKDAVPFGKWTEANQQEYLHKINSSNSGHSKMQPPGNTNDLHRRDFIKKVEEKKEKLQQQSNVQKAGSGGPNLFNPTSKLNVKKENSDKSKKSSCETPVVSKGAENPKRTEINNQDLIDKTIEGILMEKLAAPATHEANIPKQDKSSSNAIKTNVPAAGASSRYPYGKVDVKRTLLDDIEMKMNELHGIPFVEKTLQEKTYVRKCDEVNTSNFDMKAEINMLQTKTPVTSKTNKIPNLLPLNSKNVPASESKMIGPEKIVIDDENSENEVLDCEPVTGDTDLNQVADNNVKSFANITESTEKKDLQKLCRTPKSASLKEEAMKSNTSSVLTEGEFDKFVRRNSTTYENCITLSIDSNKKPHAVRTVVKKDEPTLKPTLFEDNGTKFKNLRSSDGNKTHLAYSNVQLSRDMIYKNQVKDKKSVGLETLSTNPYSLDVEVEHHKNFPSKLQMAYKSVLSAKRQKEPPIKILEDKPVKVVYMESDSNFLSYKLNVQGQKLIQTEKQSDPDVSQNTSTLSSCDSLELETLGLAEDKKETEVPKVKHQRKQVLTPVETPELVLIEPKDLGAQETNKRKRKIDNNSMTADVDAQSANKKSPKRILPKKTYLLGRVMGLDAEKTNTNLVEKPKLNPICTVPEDNKETNSRVINSGITLKVDKPKEVVKSDDSNILETTVISKLPSVKQSTIGNDTSTITPKRGPGRPRKYPIQDDSIKVNKDSSSPKKMKLIELSTSISDSLSSEDDDDSDEEEIIRENWTMGRINENIVCPICKKLFRSENVVFKHVKHCSRALMSPKSRKRFIQNHNKQIENKKREAAALDHTPKKSEIQVSEQLKSSNEKESGITKSSKRSVSLLSTSVSEVIVVEDSPKAPKHKETVKKGYSTATKTTPEATGKSKHPPQSNKSLNTQDAKTDLSCELCGKSFRQFSYLVNHRAIHKKEPPKRKLVTSEIDSVSALSCKKCKKTFRELHHLVSHRSIHNKTSASTSKAQRKSSLEEIEPKESTTIVKDKSSSDNQHTAGFRCEPCDKSFRKLHYLAEHREKHNINKQTVIVPPEEPVAEKTPDLPLQCDVCQKSFRQYHHLIEHRERKCEKYNTDDKADKKPALAIIHECSLCYMVFPNEPSLNKHIVICQKKKKQPGIRQSKEEKKETSTEGTSGMEEPLESKEVINNITIETPAADTTVPLTLTSETSLQKIINAAPELVEPEKVKENENIVAEKSVITTTQSKLIKPEKIGATVSKRARSSLLQSIEERKVSNSYDSEDDIRYMINPFFEQESDDSEKEIFMKIKVNKRNSLQFDVAEPKEALKPRSMSLQTQPTRVPRMKVKAKRPENLRRSVLPTNNNSSQKLSSKIPTVPSTSSKPDDKEVKYSFPKNSGSNVPQNVQEIKKISLSTQSDKPQLENGRTVTKRIPIKKKSLTSIAKRKSLGKTVSSRHKDNQPEPSKSPGTTKTMPEIKKRKPQMPHVCDCGKLFPSATLLAQHTTVAHTPPRIRKARTLEPSSARAAANKVKKVVAKMKIPHSGVPLTDKMKKLVESLKL